jgi:diacylglycerol O-acyltransferase / wax synthase
MRHHRNSDHLSWGDTVFLHLEREGMPLHIAGISVLEGAIPLNDCIRFIASKLPLIPRYRQRVVAPLFNIGLPTWEFDPDFDIRNHIRQVTLRHGTESELKAVAARILSKMMDRQRPLWDLTLVRGLKGDRSAIILRIHHCLADGIAGVGLMNVIMDDNPAVPPPPKRLRRFRVPPPHDPLTSLLDGWMSSYTNIIETVLSAQSDVLNMAERIVGGNGTLPTDQLTRLLPELAAPTEPLHFNVTCRGPQKYAWAQIPLAEIKAIKNVCGCSVNDVLLTLVTSTIRRYAELHGDRITKRLLRLMVPVNLRSNGDTHALGNRISLIPVTVPLDIRDPRKQLAAVRERTEFLKRSHVAELVSLAGGLVSVLPSPLQALAGPVASQLPITPFNLVCTNVPGPQFPLYLMGHKMLHWYPYVPIGGDMALNCAILSYNGTMYFGFSGDVHAAPDLARLEKFLKLSAAELREAAGIQVPKKRGRPRVRPKFKRAATVHRPTATIRMIPLPTTPSVVTPPRPRPTTEEERFLMPVGA